MTIWLIVGFSVLIYIILGVATERLIDETGHRITKRPIRFLVAALWPVLLAAVIAGAIDFVIKGIRSSNNLR